MAFFGCDLEEEEKGEFELELSEVIVVRTSGCQARNDLLTLLSWSPSQIRPLKNEPIQLLLLLPEWEPQVLLGEDSLARPTDALVLSDDETHVWQTRP